MSNVHGAQDDAIKHLSTHTKQGCRSSVQALTTPHPEKELRNITKVYHLGEIDLPVLKGISLRIEDGEFVSLTGASGSGKSTLMNLLGGLDHPSSGEYLLDGRDVAGLNADERARMRNSRIGFVFQNFNLLPRTSALENVMMPAYYQHPAQPTAVIRERALELIRMVGLEERMHHTPAQLSGGQQPQGAGARGNRPGPPPM